ncbi:GNAT family N-acetyltransferase [Candidatus Colwellia aromaticivorans]|uniref:GNAT family N-acetyltransferase n=1 Tax=Candidatus Colwellia aromaticivorans TaxID=2267621 RepID=UPI000DF1C06F|nr:GNAT family N-acetyltransferase [Candidatus Colwellia aromaticivorans]
MKSEFVNSIDKINEVTWQSLANSSSPFINYQFFKSLENSQSVSSKTGWQPHHLLWSKSNNVDAILPMYIKQHSWGEYVFDWAWADAYQEHNEPYYPKLVATIPFTPISTPKLMGTYIELSQVFSVLTEHCLAQNINSWHILYTQKIQKQSLRLNNVFHRNTVQFHWFNHQYHDFSEFLSTFTARKRKNVKKERLSISQQNIKVRRILGKDITTEEISFFYLTYQLTYLKRGHSPHLTSDFFSNALKSLPNNILLVIASVDGCDVACAWFFFDEHQLYGRYWGCTQAYNNLHFELCYYQGIDFCIEHKLQVFNPGAQGEHKIQRGFEPVLTHSYHWIKHLGFRPAIQQFCLQEQQQMQLYLKHCQQFLPFKAETS